MNQELSKAIEDLLRRIPDKWQRVDTDQLSVTEQQALLRLVGAGLVERRNTIRLDMAGQNEVAVIAPERMFTRERLGSL